MGSQSLHFKITRIIVWIALAGFLLAAVFTGFSRYHEVRKNFSSAMTNKADIAGSLIYNAIFTYDEHIANFLNQTDDLDPENLLPSLIASLRFHSVKDLFYVLDSSGTIVFPPRLYPSYNGFDMSNILPMDQTEEKIVLHHQSLFSSLNVVSILCFLPNKKILVIERNLQNIITEMVLLEIGQQFNGALVFVLSDSGRVIYHPDSTLMKSRYNLGFEISEQSKISSSGLFTYQSQGKKYIGYRNPLSIPHNWTVYCAIPYSILSHEILKAIIYQLIFVVVLFFLLFISLRTALNRFLSQPVKNIVTFLKQPVVEKKSAATFSAVETDIAEFRAISEAIQQRDKAVSIAEKSLQEEKELLAVTLKSIGDGIITTDTGGIVLSLNKVAEQITGWNNKDAAGQKVEKIFTTIDGKTGKPLGCPAYQILKHGIITNLNQDYILITKDGNKRNIADSVAPVRDKESNIIGVVLVFRDVTEQLRTEEELIKAKKLESVGVLAGGIAHDFNNILVAIMGNISLAANLVDKREKVYSLIKNAEKASLRAKDLTGQLLTFAKGGDPVKQTAAIGDLIKETANFVLHGSQVACTYHIPDNLWLTDIDSGQISQVIQNLVINALQAMPEGGTIDIACTNITFEEDEAFFPLPAGDYIEISLKDHGIGIQEESLAKIFDPYFSTKKDGSGLGLAISYSIVNKHKGHLAVQSQIGKGTTFTIYLPATSHKQQQKQKIMTTTESSPVKTGKVMIMDDDEVIQMVAGDMLEHLGYEAVFADDGHQAMELYKKLRKTSAPVKVIIMDLTIPGGMGGKEAVEKILAVDPDAKVIVSSGYSNDPVMSNYQKYGFVAAIAKPFTMEELATVLDSIF
ncbi:MAG: ATP-binding protein [Pseudomonadota bacterium]|nr:ATP-binding protein [Pseudomonadota bacterium]